MTIRLQAGVSITDTPDAAVLLNEKTGKYWQLNSTGVHILRELLAGKANSEIAEELAQRYPITLERAQADVDALAQQVCSAGLVIE